MRKIPAFWFSLLAAGLCRAAPQEEIYTYDAAGRLRRAFYTAGSSNAMIEFTCDKAANRTSRRAYGAAMNSDFDGNGLEDRKELIYFGDLGQDPNGDPDGDMLVNSNEFRLNGNPWQSDTDDDGQDDREESVAGTALADGTEYFYVTNQVRVAGGQFRIQCDTKAGRTYQLQRCLQPSENWADEGLPYPAMADGSYSFDVSSQTNRHNFRIKVWITP